MSEEFAIGRITSAEADRRATEIERARRIREENLDRDAARLAARAAARAAVARDARVRAAAAHAAESVPTGERPAEEREQSPEASRELQPAGC
ncbi:hypothetical protein [Leifsonia poae]|uniref:hypothetical protein n=1 Tax=Leifsonia poae TaxID=110933 RepID=UPI001CBC68D8|nr:hypothetical protein [Leifsonia poae]